MSQENVELVLRTYAAFSEGDLTTVLQQLDPEVVSYTAAPLDPAEYRGHEGFLEWCENWLSAFDEFTMEVESQVDAGQAVVLGVRQRATGQTSGVPVERTFWFVHVLSEGRIARIGIHATEEQALEAAGLSAPAMSEENVELIRRAYEAVARSDLDTANSYMHPEVEFHTYARSPAAGVYRGREAVRRYNEDLFATFESIRFELNEIVDAGERVVVLSTQHAVPKGGQREMHVQIAEVWTVRDGLLAERRSYPTRAEALEAAGLSA
jgi:uncharacterized protein